MRRSWGFAAVAAAETVLLFLYYRKSGVWISVSEWFSAFTWQPAAGPFEWSPFVTVAMLSLSAAWVFATWLLLAGAIGAVLLRRIDWPQGPRDERLMISIGLGLGLLSLVFFFLGLARLYTRPATLAAGVALLALCVYEERRMGRLPRLKWRFTKIVRTIKEPASTPMTILGLLCAVMLAFHLLGALLPPMAFDEMNYHLALPKLYTLNRGFTATPFNHLSYLPRNMSMLFVLGLLSGGPVAAKLFSWGMGALAAAALYVFARNPLGRRAAFLSAAAFFLTPVVGNQLRVAAADLGTAFYELVAVFLFLRWREDRTTRTLALSSVFWGLALGCKYTALPGFAACGIAWAWTLRRTGTHATGSADPWVNTDSRDGLNRPSASGAYPTPERTMTPAAEMARGQAGGQVALEAAALVGPALLLWSPWLIKNWCDSGNPLNPILSTVIHSRNFNFAGEYRPLVDYAVGLGIRNYFPIQSLRDVLLLPWHLVTQHNDFNHDLGPTWLLCIPLLFLRWKERPPRWLLGAMGLCALYWAFWLCSSIRMTRYFVAGIGLTSLLVGWLAETTLSSPRWRWALLAPLLFAWSQQAARMIHIQNIHKKPWGYLAGRCSPGDYLNAILPDSPYDAYDYINRKTPPDSTVLVFNEFRTFYLDRNFLASTPWDHDYWHELVRVSRDADDLHRRLKERGITHLLANDNYLRHQTGLERPETWTPEETVKARRFVRDCMQILYFSDNGVWVAKVKERS